MPLALLYHDVVDPGLYDSSGFPGPDAARYKLTHNEFTAHLDAIVAVTAEAPAPLLTFDDGGSSASYIATELERRGWRGHFFITTDRIGSPGFVDADQIRDLRARGHTVGTHSCSHPTRMSWHSHEELLREWRDSSKILAEILGGPVTHGSVPGGYYSRVVAEAAASTGLCQLFTSEPTRRKWVVAGCTVIGRYSIYRGMSAQAAASLAARRPTARLAQATTWTAKKLAKRVGGTLYDDLRSIVLGCVYRAD